MDIQLLDRLNMLWRPIYPYLAQWIAPWCPTKTGWILEVGPFSGGICEALMSLSKNMKTVSVMPQDGVAQIIKKQFGPNLETVVGSPDALPFEASFNLAIFRGAFFFLTPKMIKEAYRVLKSQAHAVLGGGYGPLTPSDEIAKLADESKRLNYQLGKKWISRAELEEMVKDAGVERYSKILEEGGLWLLLNKR
jgi:hypothetical protein